MKQFCVMYTSDQVICGYTDHVWGYFSTVAGARRSFSRLRKFDPSARDVRVYDTWDESDDDAPLVYSEN